MLKKIIISESQFNRLFINEQIGGGISGIGNISKELPITDRKSPDYKKLLDSIDVHTVIDIGAIVSLAIPIAGPFISAGLEILNGILYISEGDNISGGLSIGLSLIPGGLLLRRGLVSKKILKRVDDLLIKNPKILKSNDPNEVINLIKKGLGKDADKNINLIIKYINTVKKIPVNQLNDFQKLIKQYPKLFTEFTKNENILKQFLEKNNNNFYNAFKSFISKYVKKEMKSTLSIYMGFFIGIKTIQEAIFKYKKHLVDIGVKKENIKNAEILVNNLIKERIELEKKEKQIINDIKKIEITKDTLELVSTNVDLIMKENNISEVDVYNNELDNLISRLDSIDLK